MFDIGWPELFVIAVITILVVGPKEIPTVLRTVMSMMRKVKDMAREFQSGIDDVVREAELDEMKRELEKSADIKEEIEQSIDPDGELSSSIRDMKDTVEESGKPGALENNPADTGTSDAAAADPQEKDRPAAGSTG